jgi:hypothetical protein
MFNLLMSGNEKSLQGQPWELERSRVFEYTNKSVRDRFQELNPQQMEELCGIPTLIAYERFVQQNAKIARIDRIQKLRDNVRITYTIIPGLPEILPDRIHSLQWELELEEWELNRTHWAVKDVDLARELIAAGILNNDQLNALPTDFKRLFDSNSVDTKVSVSPKVFRVPNSGIENDLVSVMLPFSAEFHSVFETIKRVGKELELRVQNANQVWEESEIIQDVFSLIYRSKIVVCDFSGKNPNVFYEAGIAHTLGRLVIPIVQSASDIPFDLKAHRHIIYSNDIEGQKALFEKLFLRMKTLSEKKI